MIIGIDESGNFDTDKVGMYTAAFIRSKKLKQIEKKFLEWEAALPRNVKEKCEIKGYLLDNLQLNDFINSILLHNGHGKILHQTYAIAIDDDNAKALKSQRELNVQQMYEGSINYKRQGKEFHFIAGQYEQMAEWLKSKSLKTLYKIELLGVTIVHAFNLAIIVSVVRDLDRELVNLTIKIDEGLVDKESSLMYWHDIMKSIIWNYSYREPFVHDVNWRPNHPFLKRFMKNPSSLDRKVEFTNEIQKCMNFHNSNEHFEIRIADIIVSTYYRFYVKNEAQLASTMKQLQTLRANKSEGSYKIIRMTGVSDGKVPNPYEEFKY